MNYQNIKAGKYYSIRGHAVLKCLANNVGKPYKNGNCSGITQNVEFDGVWFNPNDVMGQADLKCIEKWIAAHKEKKVPCEKLERYRDEILGKPQTDNP